MAEHTRALLSHFLSLCFAVLSVSPSLPISIHLSFLSLSRSLLSRFNIKFSPSGSPNDFFTVCIFYRETPNRTTMTTTTTTTTTATMMTTTTTTTSTSATTLWVDSEKKRKKLTTHFCSQRLELNGGGERCWGKMFRLK